MLSQNNTRLIIKNVKYLIILLLTAQLAFGQEKRFVFESIDVRTPDGWDIKK